MEPDNVKLFLSNKSAQEISLGLKEFNKEACDNLLDIEEDYYN